jgi:hypothetical protein
MVRGEISEAMALRDRERQRQKLLDELRRDTLRKIDFLVKKTVIEYHDVYHLVREFFMEFLERRYQFTINELRQEIKHVYIPATVRQSISRVLQELEAAEYATVHFPKAKLVAILLEFRGIVEQLVHVHTVKPSLWQRLMLIFGHDPVPEVLLADLPSKESQDPQRIKLYTIVEQCYLALNRRDLRKAKWLYESLIKEYEGLDEETKEEHYPVIHQTYLDLMNRAKMLGHKTHHA